jgi:hypothetical protein
MLTAVFSVNAQLFSIFDHAELVHSWPAHAGRKGRRTTAHERSVGSGPLPRGRYAILPPRHHPRLGPVAFPLEPTGAQQMFQRSGFLIHGDSVDGDASRGCIILRHSARTTVRRLGVRVLRVI